MVTYDPMDPNGNVTIRWDVMQHFGDGKQFVLLWIVNHQLFRHVDFLGWKLSWVWLGDEVIWTIKGAEATEQGNCSAINSSTKLLQRGSAFIYDSRSWNIATLKIQIGSCGTNVYVPRVAQNFSLGLPGYTCGDPIQVPATKYFEYQGHRTQAISTYNVTCSYSQFRAASAPTYCVSLSAFYNETIIPCQTCSCACQGQNVSSCVRPGDLPPVLQLQPNEQPRPVVLCSHHMCPIQVH